MATIAHTIYSRYDPATQREHLERETGQIPQQIDPAEAWEAEAKLAFHKRQLPPPRFVPAQAHSIPEPPRPRPPTSPASDVAGWYRSLTENYRPRTDSPSPAAVAGPSSMLVPRPPERRDKNNWFIMNAIASEPPPVAAAPSTLADILERDPPQEGYAHPVWLAIGPSNKGFAMLQNSGWREGDPLGPSVRRRRISSDREPHEMIRTTGGTLVKEEAREEPIWRQTGSSEEVIDLTMSDSEPSDESDSEHDTATPIGEPTESSSRKALITPISTVLKSDRLGIGLKAKTVGPYKASQKRITHSTAAMSAHIKAAEELRKQKKKMGRGHRAFARQRKVEETNRKELLAYMNAG
ncbi:hypothetical protein C8R46DRAFT_1080084 [Mycena filopes]|nr:hypothetical protein C8R46DRAFT_1080084 [Mycena filopes]